MLIITDKIEQCHITKNDIVKIRLFVLVWSFKKVTLKVRYNAIPIKMWGRVCEVDRLLNRNPRDKWTIGLFEGK